MPNGLPSVAQLTGTVGQHGLFTAIDPLLDLVGQKSRQASQVTILGPSELAALYVRGAINAGEYWGEMARWGFTVARAEQIATLGYLLMDTDSVLQAERRKIIDPTTALAKLEALGWRGPDIEALEKLGQFIPTPNDVITWIGKEVFEPDSIKRFGLGDEFDKLKADPKQFSLFAQNGISEQQAFNYWVAHWQHPAFVQMVEMVRRHNGGDKRVPFGDEIFDEWFRLVEVPPYWRGPMKALVYEPYTRVDIRRMWKLGVLDDAETKKAYMAIGYDEEKAEKLLIFTKLEESLPELRAQYAKGWIKTEELQEQIVALGLKKERAAILVKSIIPNEGRERVAKQRDLTQAMIVKSVKKGTFTRPQGNAELVRLGYDQDEADVILLTELGPEGAGEETRLQIADTVRRMRLASGLPPEKAVPQKVLDLEQSYYRALLLLAEGEKNQRPQSELVTLKGAVDRLRAELRTVGLSLGVDKSLLPEDSAK